MSIVAAQLVANVVVTGAGTAAAQLSATGAAAEASAARFREMATIGAGVLVAGLVAVGVKSIEMAGNFQQATNTLITSAGLQKSSIDAVRAGILKMSVDTATSWPELVKGMFNVTSALHLGAGGLLVLKAAAEGAKAENSDLAQTTDVLTTAMVNYKLPASQAVDVMNSLIATVAAGKLHMNDLTGSLRNVLPVAAAFHIDLAQVEGALSTMANAGDRGTSAGTHLAMMFKMLSAPVGAAKKEMAAMGLDSIKLAETMRTNLPGALKMIQDAVAQHFTPGSVEYQRAILAILGGSKSGVAGLEIMNQGLKVLGKNTADAAAALSKGSTDVENWAIIQHNFNFQMEAAKNAVAAAAIGLGTLLLPALGKLLGFIPPLVDYLSQFSAHAGTIVPILSGVGAVIVGLLVPAIWSLAAGIIGATWPVLLVGAAIAGLVAIFMHLYASSAPFKAFIDNLVVGLKQLWQWVQANVIPALQRFGQMAMQVGGFLMANLVPAVMAVATWVRTGLWPVLQQIGAFLATTFAPVWKQLVDVWNGQILPSLKQLWGALQPLLPVLKALAGIVIAVVIVALGLLVGVLAGVARGLAMLLGGLAIVIGGVVQVFTGIVQILSGIVTLIYDLVTGNFKKLGSDLGMIWQGILNVVSGIWNIIVGIFIGAFGAIIGFVSGFVEGIVHFFQWLWHTLVGGSIVPDMINGIIRWFASLPGRVFSLVSSLVIGVVNFFLALAQQAIAHAVQLVNGVVSAVAQLPGRVGGWIASMARTVLGGLASLAGQALSAGLNIVANIASGIINGIGSFIGNAMSQVGSFISSHLPHSPAKLGPLRDLDKQSAMISEMIAAGLIAGMPRIQAAMGQLMKPVSIGITASAPGLSAAYASRSSLGTTTIVVQPPDLILDGVRLSRTLLPHLTSALRYNV